MNVHPIARVALLVAAVASVTACAARARPPAGNTAYGSYPFKTAVPRANPPMSLQGTVVLLPDTVMMTLGGKSCSGAGSSKSSFIHNCGEYSFYFSKVNPLRSNSYRVPTVVWEMRRVCKEYTTNRTTMAEQCSKYGQERVETRLILTGSLSFIER